MRKMIFIWLSVFLSSNAIANQEETLNLACPIQKQYVCSSEGCNSNPPSVTIRVQREGNDPVYYLRCDQKGCDKYESSISQSGIYTEVMTKSGSSRLKIDFENMSFMENTSL